MVKIPRIQSGHWRFGYVSAIITCLAAGVILVAVSGHNSTANRVASPQSQAVGTVAQQTPAALPFDSSSQSTGPQTNGSVSSSQNPPAGSSGQSPATSAPNSTAAQSTPASNSQVTATLMVNSTVQGVVKLAAGSNQCDVLSQALADGVISQLTMKYDSRYKSHGVYQINGQGDANSVWWVYEVNNQKVPRGCDGVTVHDGDTANWKYIRS